MGKFIEPRIGALERELARVLKQLKTMPGKYHSSALHAAEQRIRALGTRITAASTKQRLERNKLQNQINKLQRNLMKATGSARVIPHNLKIRLEELESYMQTALRELGEINFQKGNGDDHPRWGTNYKGDALTEWESLENAARYSGIGAAKLKTLGEQGLIDVRKKTDARGYLAHLPSIDAYFKTLPSIAKSTQQQGGDHEKQA